MREFEDRFVTLGLPYRVIGGPRFYERQEIRDALAYLRVVHSGADDLAFERIINVPKRGLGDATVQLLHDHARRKRVPLTEAARALIETDELKPKPRGALRDLLAAFERWRAQKEALPHTRLAEIVLDESGYTEMWQKDRTADAAGRLENLKELIRSMEEFENLAGFLEHISLVMDTDKSEGEAVSIMTLHSAKGLEFDTVFLPGWEEGLFPHQRALDDQGRAGLEEERRLAHVGLTRARRRAKIYFAANRRMHGLWSSNIPSRFLDELPEADVEITESKGSFSAYGNTGASRFDEMTHFGSSYSTPGWQRAQARGRGGFGGGFGDKGGFSEDGDEYAARDDGTDDALRSPSPLAGEGRVEAGAAARARASRSPSKANSSPSPPAPSPTSRSANACFTRSSATATSPPSTATSSPSRSTRPAKNVWWTASWSGCEDTRDNRTSAPVGAPPALFRARRPFERALALLSRASAARHRSRACPRSAVGRRKSGKPDLRGPRGDTTDRSRQPCCTRALLRWVPALVPLGFASLHSAGTREHVSGLLTNHVARSQRMGRAGARP
jgi:hypothetical protein